MYGKKEDRWLSLITRGMTTQPHAKRTSRIVSFLMVFGITARHANLKPEYWSALYGLLIDPSTFHIFYIPDATDPK